MVTVDKHYRIILRTQAFDPGAFRQEPPERVQLGARYPNGMRSV